MASTPIEDRMSKIRPLLSEPDKIRNFAVIGRVDHGRTTLVNHLLATESSSKREGEQTPTGSQQTTPLILEHSTGPHLANLIEVPRYSSYDGQLQASFNVIDGAIIVVDAIEGYSIHAGDDFRALIKEPVKPILHINKLDRAFLELQLDSEDLYHTLERIIESANVMFSSYHEGDADANEVTFDPLLGNVSFGSGLQGWAFTLPQFARFYAKRFNQPYETALKRLWGDQYYNPETKKFQTSNTAASGEKLRRFICKAILDPINYICQKFGPSTPLDTNQEEQEKIITSLGINLSMEQLKACTSTRERLKTTLSSWLPIRDAFTELIIEQLPSPRAAQIYRYETLYKGPSDNDVAQSIKCCNPDGPLIVFIFCKSRELIPEEGFLPTCYGRVFSGTLKAGEAVFILAPGYDPQSTSDMSRYLTAGVPIASIKLLRSPNSMENVDSAPAGNIVCLEGLDPYVLRTATIADSIRSHTIRSSEYNKSYVVSVKISPKDPAHLAKLLDGLRSLTKSNDQLQILPTEDGNFELFGAGELQLEIALRDLQDLTSYLPSLYSEPAVCFRETVISTLPTIFTSKNGQNTVRISAERLPTSALPIAFATSEDHQERMQKIVEQSNGKLDLETLNRTWFFGPSHEWHNLVAASPDSDLSSGKHVKGTLKVAFEEVIESGVLCGEPLRNVRFNLSELSLTIDSKKSSTAHASDVIRQAMYGAQIQAQPRMVEPIYKMEVEAVNNHVDLIAKVLLKRRGAIVSSSVSHYGAHAMTIIAHLPVAESFGVAAEVRCVTQGSSLPFLVVDHWRIIEDDPLVEGTLSNTIVKAIRKRKGLSSTLPKPSDFNGPA